MNKDLHDYAFEQWLKSRYLNKKHVFEGEEIRAYFEEGWHLIVKTEKEYFKYLYHEGVIAEQSVKYPVKNGVLEFNVLGVKLLGFGEPN